ncbi:hypothetical protein [Dyadobacter sp. 3J3]|uniref:hypothetical protein n=1 Tax=Dyadobacter sp. 3J3 TaxID=2606600 RepID=UPI001356E30A|nr:hypothetical protein [Dyadobacter sp. 3J3]
MRKFREMHGETNTDLFKKWASMRQRVLSKWKGREHYFDKGITVCSEWEVFTVFRDWALENGYEQGLELDRKENDKGYYPENCRFVTKIVNTSNRSNTVMVDYDGELISLTLLSEKLKWPVSKYNTIRRRIHNGWDSGSAIQTPLKVGNFGHKGSISVIDSLTGQKFNSVKEAALHIGVSRNHLTAMLSGKRSNKTNFVYE